VISGEIGSAEVEADEITFFPSKRLNLTEKKAGRTLGNDLAQLGSIVDEKKSKIVQIDQGKRRL
jgi:hypothetical protein